MAALGSELQAAGERVSRKRVARLMRDLGIQGVTRRRFKTATTRKDAKARPAPDLVNRNFSADGPDQLWVADITHVPTWAGWLYLAVVLDAWSRRIVGWAMAPHMRAELVEGALAMAISNRKPKGRVVHHSDQGSQYTSLAFGKRCREAGVVQEETTSRAAPERVPAAGQCRSESAGATEALRTSPGCSQSSAMYVASLTGMTREKRNHIRHHQPQKPTVRESGVAPWLDSFGIPSSHRDGLAPDAPDAPG